MKKITALLLALVMVLGLAACGGKKTGGQTGGGSSGGDGAGPVTLAICLASEPEVLDPAQNSAVDGATMAVQMFAGLAKWSQNADGVLEIVPDCITELSEPVMNADGTVTYTYTLRDGLKWSDGKDLTAKDFEFSWKRAADENNAFDYGYLYEIVKGYPNDLAVSALDDKTLEVTLTNELAYWDQLIAFPTFFPVREDVVANEAWCTDASTFISNGAFYMSGWDHNSLITLEKNPYYHDAANVTVDKLECYLSDDENNQLVNFESGAWQMIDGVPVNEIERLKKEYPTEYYYPGQLGTYYIGWNVNTRILPASSTLTGVEAEKAQQEIRFALGLLLDRNYLVTTVANAGRDPAYSFVSHGMPDADGSDFAENSGHNDGYPGYYDVSPDAFESNWNQAVETLKKYYTWDEATQKFTDFPPQTYLYNTSDYHKAYAEYICAALDSVGVTFNMQNEEWNSFLQTRKKGNFSVAREGWVADYMDPSNYLDMWISSSGNNDMQFGKGDHASLAMYNLDLTGLGYDVKVENGTWAETYDVLCDYIKRCTEPEKRFKMLHMAEDMIMATGCIVPIDFYTDLYMLDDSVHGMVYTPLGYKYFMYCTIDG